MPKWLTGTYNNDQGSSLNVSPEEVAAVPVGEVSLEGSVPANMLLVQLVHQRLLLSPLEPHFLPAYLKAEISENLIASSFLADDISGKECWLA